MRKYRFPWSFHGKDPATSLAIFRKRPRSCTDIFGSNSWFGGHDWLHRYRTGNTSQYRILPGTSNTLAGNYSLSCGHPSDLLNVRHVFPSARISLCCEVELSGLFLIVRRLIPIGALLWRSSQRDISIWTSIFVPGATVGDVFLFGALSGLYFLHNGRYILLVQLLCL
jgi:hypothetical protein